MKTKYLTEKFRSSTELDEYLNKTQEEGYLILFLSPVVENNSTVFYLTVSHSIENDKF